MMQSQTVQAMLLDKHVSQLVLVQCLGPKHDTEDATSSQVSAWCSRLCTVQAVNTYARMNAKQEWGPPLKSASLDLVKKSSSLPAHHELVRPPCAGIQEAENVALHCRGAGNLTTAI